MMRTDLDHLPDAKRRELVRVVQILFEEFEAATETKSHAHRRNGQILKIILYGSHARGDWVADPVGGYFSDYDLLVVVDHEDLTDVQDYWAKADERLTREVTIAKRISAPVNFIVHSLADVNKKLRLNRYFFIDILRDGIALYESKGHPFDTLGRPRRPRTSHVMSVSAFGFPTVRSIAGPSRRLGVRRTSTSQAP